MKKLLDISQDAVKAITIQAINEGTVFKLKAEQILTDYAKRLMVFKNTPAKKKK
jgi:hypothetical protein